MMSIVIAVVAVVVALVSLGYAIALRNDFRETMEIVREKLYERDSKTPEVKQPVQQPVQQKKEDNTAEDLRECFRMICDCSKMLREIREEKEEEND